MSINLADWLNITREERANTRKNVWNNATLRHYFHLSRMFTSAEENFQSGDQLVDFVRFSEVGNGGFYNPVARFSHVTRDTTKKVTVYWAFYHNSYEFIREAAALNDKQGIALAKYTMTQEQRCEEDSLADIERALWALPNANTMESATIDDSNHRRPYSIPCFITRDGLVPSSSNGGIASGSSAWTTLQGLNPSTIGTGYQNQSDTYDTSDPFSDTVGIIPMMDRLHLACKFDKPDVLVKYEESKRMKQVIATTRAGVTNYIIALRSVNDQMAMVNDPAIKGPQSYGTPVQPNDVLDTHGWTANRPDYLYVDLSVLKPFKNPALDDEVVTGPSHDHPNKTLVHQFKAYNMICHDRRSLGRGYAA